MSDAASPKKHVVIAVTLAKPGGAQVFVLQLATFLKNQGHRVTVIAGDGDWLFTQCVEASISFQRVNALGREIQPVRDLRALLELYRIIRELHPDAIHLNSSKMGVLGSIAATLSLVPRIVYCIAGWSFLESLSSWKKKVYIFAERYSAGYKDVIVCLHAGDKEVASRLKIRGHEDTQIIPNGIDLPELDRARHTRKIARHLLGLHADRFVFGTIGHFYPAKDLPRYLEACAIVHERLPEALFVLIGDGQERDAIVAARTRLALSDHVLLLGTREQAARELTAFDVFVLPSVKEGMPFTLLEAMAASLPCVMTDVGANRWVLGSTNWVVPPQSATALAEAMIEVALDRTRAITQGRAARSEVENRFPLRQTLEAHKKLLLKI